jgi:hypothetical protein
MAIKCYIYCSEPLSTDNRPYRFLKLNILDDEIKNFNELSWVKDYHDAHKFSNKFNAKCMIETIKRFDKQTSKEDFYKSNFFQTLHILKNNTFNDIKKKINIVIEQDVENLLNDNFNTKKQLNKMYLCPSKDNNFVTPEQDQNDFEEQPHISFGYPDKFYCLNLYEIGGKYVLQNNETSWHLAVKHNPSLTFYNEINIEKINNIIWFKDFIKMEKFINLHKGELISFFNKSIYIRLSIMECTSYKGGYPIGFKTHKVVLSKNVSLTDRYKDQIDVFNKKHLTYM